MFISFRKVAGELDFPQAFAFTEMARRLLQRNTCAFFWEYDVVESLFEPYRFLCMYGYDDVWVYPFY
jgi:hypothetical protein